MPVWKVPYLWFKNRGVKYKIINIDEAKKYKKSDTIFIIGSGPSVNDLTDKEWKHISANDSFGINFTYLLGYPTTFYILEDGKIPWFRKFVEERLSSRRKMLKDTVWCYSDRKMFRFIHPRITPEIFPEDPVCIYYKFPMPLTRYEDKPFSAYEFEKSVFYRGSLSLVLYLVDRLEYKNIVLLGIDMNTKEHFFDKMEEMRKYVNWYEEMHKDKDKYDYMCVKEGKMRPMDKYIYDLAENYFSKKGVNLYVGSAKSSLYPKIPLYEIR